MENAREMEMDADFEERVKPTRKEFSIWKRTGFFATVLAAVFLLGLIPMWLSEREAAGQRDVAQERLRLSQLQNRLGTSVINARRGEYEQARQSASDFFTDLRTEIDRSDSSLNPQQRETVLPILEQRDELITLLARNDAAAVERLSDLYLIYQNTVNPSMKKVQ
jgi:hypothetical protein